MDKIWLLNKDSEEEGPEEEGSENDSDLKKSRASMRLKDLIPTLHKQHQSTNRLENLHNKCRFSHLYKS